MTFDPSVSDVVPDKELVIHQTNFVFDENKMGLRPKNLTDDVIEMIAGLMARRFRKGQIRAEIANMIDVPLESLGKTFVEIALRWARVWLRSNYMNRTLEDHMAQGIAYLEMIIQKTEVGSAAGLRAQKELNNMMGIGAQFQHTAYDPEQTAEITRRMIGEMENLIEDDGSTDSEE